MGQFKATAPFAAAGSAAAGALTNSKNRLGGALQGAVGGAAGGAIGGGLSSKTGFGEGMMSGLKSYGNSIPGFGGVGTANPTGAMAKFFTPQSIQNPTATSVFNKGTSSALASNVPASPTFKVGGAISNTAPMKMPSFSVAANGAPTSVLSQGGGLPSIPTKSISKGIMDNGAGSGDGKTNWAGVAGGAVLPMAISAFQPDVQPSDFSPVTGPLKEQIMQSKNPAVESFYKGQIAGGPVDSTPGLAVDKLAHDKQLAETLRSFDQQWQGAMGGQDPSNNSEYQRQRAKIMQDAESSWTANQSQFQFQYDQQQKQQQFAAAAALRGMDDSQLNALASLAQYDIYTIAQQTGMDIASAEQIQQLAATAGSLIMQKSLGLTGAAQTASK
jgi:hypothetical protein